LTAAWPIGIRLSAGPIGMSLFESWANMRVCSAAGQIVMINEVDCGANKNELVLLLANLKLFGLLVGRE